MAAEELPEELMAGTKELLSLSDDEVRQLAELLQQISPSFSRKKVSEAVGAAWPDRPQATDAVVNSLTRMESFRSFAEIPLAKFLNLFLSDENLEGKEIEQSQVPLLEKRLSQLLTIPSISATGKAMVILTGHEHAFLSSRIFTDIRTIFGDDDALEPTAAVLIHMLRIRYMTSSETKEFFLALDNSDIQKLRASLDRAIQKSKVLQQSLNTTRLRFIDVD